MNNTAYTHIIKRKGYRLAVMPSRNRVCWELDPEIQCIPDAPEILESWLELGSYLRNEFTLILDACIEKVQHPDVVRFLLSVQEIATDSGLLNLADVVSGSGYAFHVHDQIAEMAGTKDRRRVFSDREHAEEWLDSLLV